jgi:hypothetical protein
LRRQPARVQTDNRVVKPFKPPIRKAIYTTNSIESLNRSLRKISKNRGVFPNQESLLKLEPDRAARREERERAKEFWKEATKAGMKGDRRTRWVMRKLGWDERTDESKLRRLMKGTEQPSKSRQLFQGGNIATR